VAAKEKGDYRGKRLAMFVVTRFTGIATPYGFKMASNYASSRRGLWTII
jgi:hypothetical protein